MNKSEKLSSKILARAIKYHQEYKYELAEKLYDKILQKNPNNFEVVFNLGTLYLQIKKFDKSKKLLNKVIKYNPNHINSYNNLGNVFNELGELQNSKECFKKIIKIDSKNTNAYNNLGIILHRLGNLKEAAEQCQKAIELDSTHVEALNNLANILNELGDFNGSIKSYIKIIEINPNHVNAINNLSILFTRVQLIELNNIDNVFLKKLFLFFYKRNDIDHGYIFSNAKQLIFLNFNLKKLENKIEEDNLLENEVIKKLIKDELFILMLKKSLIKDIFLEKILTKIRYEILMNIFKNKKDYLKSNFNFILALAENCFFNEYIFFQSNKENIYLLRLKKKVEESNKVLELETAILGCYLPLGIFKNLNKKLLSFKSKNIEFNDLLNVQVNEPNNEKEISSSIKSLVEISDSISNKVKNQYEENPYPRWKHVNKRNFMHSIDIISSQIRPNIIKFTNEFHNPNILIAGCGTGKQIFLTSNYSNAKITAVDLSRSSITYAKRKSIELGENSTEFLHADILDLKKLNRKFDIIECVGVLHHMKDPLLGLGVLCDLLEPHGFLRLGLYSKLAREEVIKIRKFIEMNNIKSTKEGIRNFRKKTNIKKIGNLVNWGDFYSISSLRDLVFHIKEHHYTIPQLSKILTKYNLKFLGFSDLGAKINYSKNFPSDKENINLDNWHKFEVKNPETFKGMYNFWVKKV